MSTQEHIERIKAEVESIKAAIREKGVDVPDTAKLHDLPEYIRKIGQ